MSESTPVAPSFVPLRAYTDAEELERRHPVSATILACDFYVTGAEHGIPEPGGFRLGRILNVDHHAPHQRMEQPITSTALAYDHLIADGHAGADSCVIIHHTDCDSILSSAMLLGNLPADPDLVAASVAADHTGEENEIADLLQALDEGRRGDRTAEQYMESLRAVEDLRAGRPLGERAKHALERRRMRRTLALELRDSFDLRDGVAFAVSDRSIDSAFFPAIVPEAAVIMVASPNVADRARWTIKLRLGESAPGGVTLHALNATEWDPNYGGRWNAGSNGRGGGTDIDPGLYVRRLRARLAEAMLAMPE